MRIRWVIHHHECLHSPWISVVSVDSQNPLVNVHQIRVQRRSHMAWYIPTLKIRTFCSITMDHWLISLTGTGSWLYSIFWISITSNVSKDTIMTRPGCTRDVEAGTPIKGYLADSQVELACYCNIRKVHGVISLERGPGELRQEPPAYCSSPKVTHARGHTT